MGHFLWASFICFKKLTTAQGSCLCRGPLAVPRLSLPSLSLLQPQVVATVTSCVTFQAWAGLWASRGGRSPSSGGPSFSRGKHTCQSIHSSIHPSTHHSIHPSMHPCISPSSECLPSRVTVLGLCYAGFAEQAPTRGLHAAHTSLFQPGHSFPGPDSYISQVPDFTPGVSPRTRTLEHYHPTPNLFLFQFPPGQ